MTETLTTAAAQGNLGRPAPSPAELYVKATAGYAARFEGLTGDALRAMETEGGPDLADIHARSLMSVLADWKHHLDRFEADATTADEKAMQAPASRAANAGMDAYLKARDAVHAAYVDWSFDLTGYPDLDDEETPAPPVAIPTGCRIPACDGSWHDDAMCTAEIAEVLFDEGSSLPIELAAPDGKPATIVAFAFDPVAMNIRAELGDQAAARAFAKALRDAADAIDDAAAYLPGGAS
ncbi:hypothetical protein OG233_13950 [Streptomyces sp. NBC_01218]|uniref:hypothetical protein n=1 Tax=Streptomyces sp. NBC_01218 TaxID=2903780 RepID=UPI002E15AD60|nr:hypothetical protein OG233_13950 [Streptomyces sp. NBC_01218]